MGINCRISFDDQKHCDFPAGRGEVGVSTSKGLPCDPTVLGSTGCTGIDKREEISRFAHFEDLRHNHMHPQCLDVLQNLCDKGLIS